MSISQLNYTLSEGYFQNWLVAGPIVRPVGTEAELDSGVTQPPVDLGPVGPLTQEHPDLTWRYYQCLPDHYVDLSSVQPAACVLQAWAYARLHLDAASAVTFALTTNGPAQLWLNGALAWQTTHQDRRRPRTETIPASL